MNHSGNLSGCYYSLSDLHGLQAQAEKNPNVLQADLDAFKDIRALALNQEREGFFVDEFDDSTAAAIMRNDGSTAT